MSSFQSGILIGTLFIFFCQFLYKKYYNIVNILNILKNWQKKKVTRLPSKLMVLGLDGYLGGLGPSKLTWNAPYALCTLYILCSILSNAYAKILFYLLVFTVQCNNNRIFYNTIVVKIAQLLIYFFICTL